MTSLEEQMQELRDLPTRVTGVESQILQLRTEMRDEFSATRTELLATIRSGDQETRNFMRALHEEARTLIATIGEGKKG